MGSAAASVVDSHPLLPTPVISHQPCDSRVLSRGWLVGLWEERREGGGGYGIPWQGNASPEVEGVARQKHGHGSAYLHPHPPACTAGAADDDDSTRLLLDRCGVWFVVSIGFLFRVGARLRIKSLITYTH